MTPSELVRRYQSSFLYGTAVAYLVLLAQVIEHLP